MTQEGSIYCFLGSFVGERLETARQPFPFPIFFWTDELGIKPETLGRGGTLVVEVRSTQSEVVRTSMSLSLLQFARPSHHGHQVSHCHRPNLRNSSHRSGGYTSAAHENPT